MTCQPNASAAAALIAWFAANQRDLPWRQDRTPYRVWVSEIMLQQTQVATVIPYFETFTTRFPALANLASAGQDEVLKAWEGLGYYARARHMHEAARQVVTQHAGELPHDVPALRELPGIGEYVAGMIASLAYGQDAPALDANGYRVLARLCAIQPPVDRSSTRRQLRDVARNLLPAGQAGAFNEALIELGALICTPRKPACEACPLGDECLALEQGLQHILPVRRPRRVPPHRDVTAAVIWQGDKVLISQRLADSMLGGLWEFPGGKCEEGETYQACLQREILEELALHIDVGAHLITFDHAYSHMHITLHAFHCQPLDGPPQAIEVADWQWIAPDELSTYPLSVADLRIAQALREELYASRQGDQRGA
jgi:A/G-specific adenine glycosylase